MKRNVLAVVIPALLAAGAANAAEVYNKDGNKLDLTGKIHAVNYISSNDNGKENYFGHGDGTYARLGFKGETKINSDLTGYGRFEYQFDASHAEDTNGLSANGSRTRYAYAGLRFGDLGSLDYGRNMGIAYDGISYTDVLPEMGGDTGYTDNLTGRNAGVLTYRNKNFFGLVNGWDFGVQYQAKHEDGTTLRRQTGDGWGVSSSYTSPIGVGVIASYAAADRTNNQRLGATGGQGEKAEAWATGLKYDANNIYLATTYGEYHNLSYVGSRVFDKTKVFEATAQYSFDFGLTPQVSYVAAKGYDDTDKTAAKTSGYLNKYVSVGANYAFNKNFSALVEYEINLVKDSNDLRNGSTDDAVAVGVTYQF
ncbi:porin [Dickeya fangzhongdai]|nr:porin [Dickeya fangzhongdai]UWH09584.1 porin [Dickeya fangzhongdai]